MPPFADLHCHPIMRGYNTLHDLSTIADIKSTTPVWTIPASKKAKLERGKRATKYSQSDFAKLIKGNVKLVVAALYPFEQGFVQTLNSEAEIKKMIDEVENVFDEDDDQLYQKYKNEVPIPAFLAALLMGIPAKRIKAVRNDDTYDYWEEFKKEYALYCRASNVQVSADVYSGTESALPNDSVLKGRCMVINKQTLPITDWLKPTLLPAQTAFFDGNATEIDNISAADNQPIVVFSVEGAHLLSLKNQFADVLDEEEILGRTHALKQLNPPIFFLTLGHHFDNKLCAHAHSFPAYFSNFVDQTPNMNTMLGGVGVSELGLKVLRLLLHIDETHQPLPTAGWRILIDVKHMSSRAREDYYNHVIKPYNATHPDAKIPIIASHMGYSGKTTLQALHDGFANETNDLTADGFLPWNINLCDEEINYIVESEGLIGLCLEQRVLGVKFDLKRDVYGLWSKKAFKESVLQSPDLLWKHIESMAKAVGALGQYDEDSPAISFWDCLCLGSDFDGVIDPLNKYPTVLSYEQLGSDLAQKLQAHGTQFGIDTEAKVKNVVAKICSENIINFVKKHFLRNHFEGQGPDT